jgi:predicted DNA-binding transcriptional regulator AlpA
MRFREVSRWVRHRGSGRGSSADVIRMSCKAAEILSLSRSSIYQLIWSDQLTPIRIGRSARFSVEHVRGACPPSQICV